MCAYPVIEAKRRDGTDSFHTHGATVEFNLMDFWAWSTSDLVSNATRGILAEYLVAQALGVANGNVREEWAAFDLTCHDGTRVEVKSAAYVQSWQQERLSRISFNVRKTRAWSKDTNLLEDVPQRQADVYVFALLAHKDQHTIDPLDLSQWAFYVLPTAELDRRTRSQHSITLASLQVLARNSVPWINLREAIEMAGKRQREMTQGDSHPDPNHHRNTPPKPQT
ncbi:MAG: hypothetical protein KDA63_21395 [Planctomycetales bacterium]|nr:hypothetical protein [Planctomycetales bacterium]